MMIGIVTGIALITIIAATILIPWATEDAIQNASSTAVPQDVRNALEAIKRLDEIRSNYADEIKDAKQAREYTMARIRISQYIATGK